MAKRLASEFCRQTHSMLDKLMQKRRQELDVKLLIFAIQRTANFESLLCKRFPDAEVEAATSTNSESVLKRNFFHHVIGSVFESHMSVYIAAQDKNFSSLIEQFCVKIREGGALGDKNTHGVDLTAVTFPSSGDLFMVYKKCIQQTTQLTSDIAVLVELAQILKKYLREYCYKYLNKIQNILLNRSSGTRVVNCLRCLVGSLPKTGSSSGSQFTSTSTLIQSLLKEGDAVKLTRDEIYVICCVLTTAEFCAETTQQLQDKLKEKVQNTALHQRLDMNAEQDIFHAAISNCIQMLVHDLECACEPAFQAMTKMQWSNVDHVGDESRYVSTIKAHFKTIIPRLRDHLANARKYFVQICLKFASSFVGKFLVYLFRCRSMNVDGAEQLLLDAHSLKTELLNLPNIESSIPRKPPVSYANVVSKGMNKAEMILKLIMTESTDHRYFVEQYLKLLPESDQSELQKILDMKGIRGTAAQSPFFEHYRNSGDQNKLPAMSIASTVITATTTKPVISVSSMNNLSAMMTSSSSMVNAYLSNVDAESTIKKLEKLVRKRVL
uniref:Vacuolar protein sorting-associated protein 53 homolog n=1 Tax=Romanomermis culicivorax TaxID=13658 RepID=A0A915ICT1_ROMCU